MGVRAAFAFIISLFGARDHCPCSTDGEAESSLEPQHPPGIGGVGVHTEVCLTLLFHTLCPVVCTAEVRRAGSHVEEW